MLFDKKPYTFDKLVRLVISLILFLCGIWLVRYLNDVLIPFVIAFILAYLINPLVCLVQKKIPNRLLAVITTLLILLLVIIILSSIVIPIIVKEIAHTGKLLAELTSDSELAQRAAKRLPDNIWKSIKEYLSRKDVQATIKNQDLSTIMSLTIRKILPGLWGFIAGATSFLFWLLGLSVILLYLVFLLLDYEKVKKQGQDLLPSASRDFIIKLFDDFNQAMSRYFRAQALIALLVGIGSAIGFSLIGLPLGFLFGLFIGLLNMVPYLQLIGLIPAIFLALIHALELGTSIWSSLGLTLLVFIVVQIIQDTFLTPKIMGKSSGLSPAIILLSLSVWGKLLGFLGLIIAIPITCLLLAYYQRFITTQNN